MGVELVPARAEHVSELGRIAYEAFKDISDRHGFSSDFSSTGFGRMVIGMLVQNEHAYGVAAMENGLPLGSAFMTTEDEVGGIGPVTVEVLAQGRGIGRALMERLLAQAREGGIERVRLQQDSFNITSLALYASLGFDTKEPCMMMDPVPAEQPDGTIRPVTEDDLPAVEELSRRIYRVSRRNEVASLMRGPFRAFLRERQGRMTGYFILGLPGHGVAETEEDVVALVREAKSATVSMGLHWVRGSRRWSAGAR